MPSPVLHRHHHHHQQQLSHKHPQQKHPFTAAASASATPATAYPHSLAGHLVGVTAPPLHSSSPSPRLDSVAPVPVPVLNRFHSSPPPSPPSTPGSAAAVSSIVIAGAVLTAHASASTAHQRRSHWFAPSSSSSSPSLARPATSYSPHTSTLTATLADFIPEQPGISLPSTATASMSPPSTTTLIATRTARPTAPPSLLAMASGPATISATAASASQPLLSQPLSSQQPRTDRVDMPASIHVDGTALPYQHIAAQWTNAHVRMTSPMPSLLVDAGLLHDLADVSMVGSGPAPVPHCTNYSHNADRRPNSAQGWLRSSLSAAGRHDSHSKESSPPLPVSPTSPTMKASKSAMRRSDSFMHESPLLSTTLPLSTTRVATPELHGVSRSGSFGDVNAWIPAKLTERLSGQRFSWLGQYMVISLADIQVVVLCLLWYGSSAVTNNLGKQLLSLQHIPVTLTYVQFMFVALFCFSMSQIADASHAYLWFRWLRVTDFSWPGSLSAFTGHYRRLSSPQSLLDVLLGSAFMFLAGCLVLPRLVLLGVCWSLSLLYYWVALGLGIEKTSLSGLPTSYSGRSYSRRAEDECTKVPSQPHRIMSPNREILMLTVPLSCFLLSGHIFSSIALDKVPVSFLHTIKALSPLFTVLVYRFYFGTLYSSHIYISLVPLTLGVMLACSFGQLEVTALGLFCAIGSTLIFVVQNIFSKKLFRDRRLDKLNLLFYSSLFAFLLMTPIWFWLEGHKLFEGKQMVQSLATSSGNEKLVFIWMVMNGVSHFFQNIFAFSVLHLVSPVTYSIASLIKRIVVIVASILWFGQAVTGNQMVGILLAMVGLSMYQRARFQGGVEREHMQESRGGQVTGELVSADMKFGPVEPTNGPVTSRASGMGPSMVAQRFTPAYGAPGPTIYPSPSWSRPDLYDQYRSLNGQHDNRIRSLRGILHHMAPVDNVDPCKHEPEVVIYPTCGTDGQTRPWTSGSYPPITENLPNTGRIVDLSMQALSSLSQSCLSEVPSASLSSVSAAPSGDGLLPATTVPASITSPRLE